MGFLLYEIVERTFCFVKTEINQIPNQPKPANWIYAEPFFTHCIYKTSRKYETCGTSFVKLYLLTVTFVQSTFGKMPCGVTTSPLTLLLNSKLALP